MHSYREEDFENCVSLYGCEFITRYFDHGLPRSKHEVKQLILDRGTKYFLNGMPYGLFSIFLKQDLSFIGQVDLLPTEEIDVLEIGFILHKHYQIMVFVVRLLKLLFSNTLKN